MAAVTLPERVEERSVRRDCLQRWSMCRGGKRVLIKEHRSGTEHVAGDKPEARTDQPRSLWGLSRQDPWGLALAPAALCSANLLLCCVEATSWGVLVSLGPGAQVTCRVTSLK